MRRLLLLGGTVLLICACVGGFSCIMVVWPTLFGQQPWAAALPWLLFWSPSTAVAAIAAEALLRPTPRSWRRAWWATLAGLSAALLLTFVVSNSWVHGGRAAVKAGDDVADIATVVLLTLFGGVFWFELFIAILLWRPAARARFGRSPATAAVAWIAVIATVAALGWFGAIVYSVIG